MTGLICLNKPADITSFGAVSKVRGITREKKCGHTGTLDPMAQGVLPIMLGGATKFISCLPDSDKGYRASFRLGITTDTLDITGSIISQRDVSVSDGDVADALGAFRGVIEQIPPMFSAVSVDGRRLYELAREGVEIEREPRRVEIKELELAGKNGEDYVIDVLCTKGTYIRTLIDDLGRALGCGAVMTSLIRTRAMGFALDDCVTLEELQEMRDKSLGFDDVLIGVEKLFECYDGVEVSEAQAKRFMNGGALDLGRIKAPLKDGAYRIYSPDGTFLGLGRTDLNTGELKILQLLTRRD
jgi:tRNA pseudouridine55 synthase